MGLFLQGQVRGEGCSGVQEEAKNSVGRGGYTEQVLGSLSRFLEPVKTLNEFRKASSL